VKQLAKIKIISPDPQDLRRIEQYILDRVRDALELGQEALRRDGSGVSNRINPLNQRAREFLRNTINLC
jgi:hypothetical protein